MPVTFVSGLASSNDPTSTSDPEFVMQAKFLLITPPSRRQWFQRRFTPAACAAEESVRTSSRLEKARPDDMGAS
jgi:hypothetical protein